jgi:large subunit ribosomal protein L6
MRTTNFRFCDLSLKSLKLSEKSSAIMVGSVKNELTSQNLSSSRESRIGKKPIPLPSGVKLTLEGNNISAKGPKGESKLDLDQSMTVSLEDDKIKVTRKADGRRARQLHGLSRTLLNNMLIGISTGFEKKLTLVGVGFRAKISDRELILTVGFSHDVRITLPVGIDATVTQNVNITICGTDKSDVGNFAAALRRVRAPEPYGGKGIRYADEVVKLKEGKSGKK